MIAWTNAIASWRVPQPTLSRDELIARAIDRGDEHVIKLTETLLSEHALDPRPVYLAAAEAAVTGMGP